MQNLKRRLLRRLATLLVTILDKALKRQLTVDGVDYTVALDPEGIRLTGKGKRKPEVELRWDELLSGEAALAVALNASLTTRNGSPTAVAGARSESVSTRAGKKRAREG